MTRPTRRRMPQFKHQKSYPAGRICAGRRCTVRLSIYNPDHLCAKCDEIPMVDEHALDPWSRPTTERSGQARVMIG